jgi:hypothetical protein
MQGHSFEQPCIRHQWQNIAVNTEAVDKVDTLIRITSALPQMNYELQ